MDSPPQRQFERHARTVTGLTVLSRFGGLARDATMSRVFGISPLMDAFAIGFQIPNLFRRLFGEGALSASFLPVFTREKDQDPATARRMAWLVIARTLILLSALVLIAELLMLSGALGGDLDSTGVRMVAIMLPYAPMVCGVALIGAMLQAFGRFGPLAAAPVILNALLVATTLLLEPWVLDETMTAETQVAWVAGSVLVTGLIQFTWVMLVIRRLMPRTGAPADEARARSLARGVGRQALPMILGLGVLQLNTLLDALIASWPTLVGPEIPWLGISYPLPEGSMASLSWAARLYEFPLGVFGIAIATAIFPQLSRERDDLSSFTTTLRRGIRLTLFIGLPATIGLILVRDPLTAVILQGNRFTAEDTMWVGSILLGYATAIWAYCLTQVLVRAFYARGEAMTPVRVAVAVVVLNLILNLTLIWTPLGVAGLAWSTAICAIVQVIVLSRLLGRRLPGLIDGPVLRGLARSVIVMIVTGLGAALAGYMMAAGARASDWWYQVLALVVLVTSGAIPGLLAAFLMGMPELGWLLGRRGSSVES